MNEKVKQFKESFAKIDKQYREVKGYGESCDTKSNNEEIDYLYALIRGFYDYVNYIEQDIYNHKTKGHIPPILGAGKMENALTVLGIGSDYEVKKPIIWTSASKSPTSTITVEYKKS